MEQSQKRKDMIKVSKLYYFGNMSQDEIARLMGISRPKVSRLLSEARQLNIVQITVNDSHVSNDENAQLLQRHFGLQYVRIVPSGNCDDAAKTNVGLAASQLLNARIQENSIIGIAWGTTLAAFARVFQSDRPVPGAKVVQLVGGTYSQSLNIDGRELVKSISKKLQCEHRLLQAPFIVHNPALRDLLMQEPAVKEHFRLVHNLDMAFVGIGTSYYKDSIAFRGHYLEEDEARELSDLGVVCDICGHQLLPDGSEPDTFLTRRIVGVTLEDLDRVPFVVGLCAGHKKVTPLLAALHGRHLDAMIIDEVAAISLLAKLPDLN